MKSNAMTAHFQLLYRQRETFLEEANHALGSLWERPLPNKWSTGETLYHLYLMLRVFRRFSIAYIPTMRTIAWMRRHHPYSTEIHDIYAEYQQNKRRAMEAPFLIQPPTSIIGTYTLDELLNMLHKEATELRMLVRQLDGRIAGNIYYMDPVANHPNLIQSIHLLAIHEQHHFELVKKYYDDEAIGV